MPRLFSSLLASRGYQSPVCIPSAFSFSSHCRLLTSSTSVGLRAFSGLGSMGDSSGVGQRDLRVNTTGSNPSLNNRWKPVNKYPQPSHTLVEATLEVWSLHSSRGAQGDELQLPRMLTHLLINNSTWFPVSLPCPSTSASRNPLLSNLIAQILV